MTTNEQILPCPVCGEGMEIGFYADNLECTGCELELPRTVMKAIQLRIDKEKAAAVQAASQFQANLDYLTVKNSATLQEAIEKLLVGEHPVRKLINKAVQVAVQQEREGINTRKLIWVEKWVDYWYADGGAVGDFGISKNKDEYKDKPWRWSCEASETDYTYNDEDSFEEAKAATELHFERHAKAIIEDLQEPQNERNKI